MLNRSIHPRNGPDFKNRIKKNTSAPSKKGGGKTLRRQRKKLDARKAAHAAMILGLPNTVPATAFRCPGSMNPGRSR